MNSKFESYKEAGGAFSLDNYIFDTVCYGLDGEKTTNLYMGALQYQQRIKVSCRNFELIWSENTEVECGKCVVSSSVMEQNE